jgi:tripartite-type tricarboxylate transporter receptor subunit TctC
MKYKKHQFVYLGDVSMQAMPIRSSLVLFILALLIYPSLLPAATEQRVALVIGNSAYSSGPLKNPVNDAADMADVLKKLGFTVMLKKDADLQEMVESIEDFGNNLKRGGVGLFYYAGHGVQTNNINYLLPVKARINKESDIRFQAVDAGRILAEMENANNGLNIVILDACRDNPFGKSFRSATRGLAVVANAPTGTLISYSTGAGQVARDGDGRNSPYTKALLENIAKPGLTINDVFMNVRTKVKKETGQVPWELSSLEGRFYFAPQVSSWIKLSDTTSSTPRPDSDDIAQQKAALERERQELAREKQDMERQQAIDAEREQLAAERRKVEAERQQLANVQRPTVTGTTGIGRRPPNSSWTPKKPVQIVVPFNPGGSGDIIGRVLAPHLSSSLGSPVVILNKPGGSGSIGAASVATATPDGTTLLLASNGIMTVNKALIGNLPFDPESDFVPIIQFVKSPQILVVPGNTTNNLKQMVSQPLTFGAGGKGSMSHLTGEAMKQATGAQWKSVLFSSEAESIAALLGGHIHAIFGNVMSVEPHINSGKLRAIAVTGSKRLNAFPNVPTFSEVGIRDMNITQWYGLFAPKGAAPEVVARLYHEVSRAVNDTQVRNNLSKSWPNIVDMPPIELSQEIRTESAFWSNLIKSASIR